MAIADRHAETSWTGTLAAGEGSISFDSGAVEPLPVTWAARTEAPGGKTSPEELAAAAHSSCFAMALNLRLGENHTKAEQMSVGATVTLDEVEGLPTIVSSAITVSAAVPDLDDERFQAIVQEAAELCPVSRLFAGATISVDAKLQ
jgi:osmotically inducible protein OsmC